jgi:regulator of sigma E protease
MLIIISVIILFSLLVILHEWGHFLAARRGGVEVEEFGIGFPPRIWGKKVGDTLYSINLLPLGGFVRLKGEDAADKGPGTFGGAKYSVKAKVLLAGVGMNLLTAVVILYGLCVTALPGLGAQFEPTFLHPSYAQPKQLLMDDVEPGSPAAQAGIVRGDYLLRVNGVKLDDETQLVNFTQSHAGQEVILHLRSNGDERDIRVRLRNTNPQQTSARHYNLFERVYNGVTGLFGVHPKPETVTTRGGILGVGSHQVYKLRYDPLSALMAAIYITGVLFIATIVGVFQLLASIPILILGLFSTSIPHAAQNASGPWGIVLIIANISSLGFAYVFVFMANIAVALAAFNVLPLPALDGGRLALITFQNFTKRKIDPELEAKIHGYGFLALLGLMVLITIYDIRKSS